jgi:hypothetical protein
MRPLTAPRVVRFNKLSVLPALLPLGPDLFYRHSKASHPVSVHLQASRLRSFCDAPFLVGAGMVQLSGPRGPCLK